MDSGRVSISRGHQLDGGETAAPRLARASQLRAQAQTEPVAISTMRLLPASPEYQLVHDRLTALERLTRLFEQGALSADEFAAEKNLILNLPADELVLYDAAPVSFRPAQATRARRSPSLMGRLVSWKILPVGLAAGVALSYASQPRETMRFFEEVLRLFGV